MDPGTRTLTPLPLGDSATVAIGEWVVAIGNPLGYSFSLTQGIVSGVARNLQAPNNAVIPNGIQTDAAINQGNSGGRSSTPRHRDRHQRAVAAVRRFRASASPSPSTWPSR